MRSDHRDGAAVRFPPPLWYAGGAVAGVWLHSRWPLPLGVDGSPRRALAVLLALVSVVFLAGALTLFHRTGQNPQPWASSPELIRGGVYRFTRNPMYLGLALVQTAAGIDMGKLWVVLLVPVACAAVYWTAIRHEEAYLEAKFGDAYRRYKRSVRRWL